MVQARTSIVMVSVLAWMIAALPLRAAEPPASVDVLLSFDTEDYLLPASDDATKRLAEMLTQKGIRATFRVVGELARTLERRGRTDVIAALRKHDVGYHSDLHSVHPTINEYMAECGLLDGVAEFVRRERQGAADVRRIFDRNVLSCYCAPGDSWNPQALVALPQIGVNPVSTEIGMHIGLRDKPFWAAGTLNVFEIGEDYTDMALHDPAALEPAKARFSEIAGRIRSEGGGLISIGYHPCDWVHTMFWDAANFRYGANPPREQWKVPPQLPAEEIERSFLQFSRYIDHIKSTGVRFITASQLPAMYVDRLRTEGISQAGLLQLARKLVAGAGVNHERVDGMSVSPADQFELLTAVAEGLVEGKPATFPLVAKGILGPDSPPGRTAQAGQMIAWPAFRDATRDVHDYLRVNGRMPPRVFIGAQYVSPADFLAGLAAAWCYDAEHRSLPPDVKLGTNLPLLTEKHVAPKPVTPFTWSIHKPDLSIARILDTARLQSWTIKPALRK